MTPSDRSLDEQIRDLYGADREAVDRVIASARAAPPRRRLGRGLSLLTVAVVVGGAAAALWIGAPESPPGEESRLFYVGDLAVMLDADGSSWVVGPGAASADQDHVDLIIVEEQEP